MGFAKPTTKLEAKPTTKAKAKRPEITLAGTEQLASLAALINALQSRYDALDEQVRDDARRHQIAEGALSGLRPETPDLLEGVGSAQYQIKSRSSRSTLTPEIAALLRENGMPVEEKTLTEAYLAVNPVYAQDQDLLQRADLAFKKLGGFPEDFIVQTPEVKVEIVGDGAIEKLFATKDAEKIDMLLDHVSSQSIAQIKVSDFNRALEVARPEVEALFGKMVDVAKVIPSPKSKKVAG